MDCVLCNISLMSIAAGVFFCIVGGPLDLIPGLLFLIVGVIVADVTRRQLEAQREGERRAAERLAEGEKWFPQLGREPGPMRHMSVKDTRPPLEETDKPLDA